MPQTRYVHAADLVAEFGFTERHWIRMAAAGRVPGARQPFGARSRWVFDLDALRAWWNAAEEEWPTWLAQPRLKQPTRGGPKPWTGRIDLKKSRSAVMAAHPQKRKP